MTPSHYTNKYLFITYILYTLPCCGIPEHYLHIIPSCDPYILCPCETTTINVTLMAIQGVDRLLGFEIDELGLLF